jgi:Terminase small subunit
MASLKNVRQEKFAQCVASGLSGSDAYRQAAEYSGKQADGNAANWMKRPGVRERIEELKAESSARCSLSREAYIKSLVEMYEARPCDASMDNPRCDVLITRGQKHAVYPQKLAVGAQLSKLVGWDRPTEVRVEAGSELAPLLGGLFAGGGRWAAATTEVTAMASAARKQAVPQAAAGVDTRQELEAFRDPVWRLGTLYSIRARDGSVM